LFAFISIFFRKTTHYTKFLNLHGYKLPNCIMRVFHLHIHIFFVYFKLVQWALKKLDSTLKWAPPEEARMDQHTSVYVDARNQMERGWLNKAFNSVIFHVSRAVKIMTRLWMIGVWFLAG
jgi:hypothetical protein